jgi:hypothetical protein
VNPGDEAKAAVVNLDPSAVPPGTYRVETLLPEGTAPVEQTDPQRLVVELQRKDSAIIRLTPRA